ncbi:MAG TPA: exo-alpha-sialidase [Nitriliruptorales bacterium]
MTAVHPGHSVGLCAVVVAALVAMVLQATAFGPSRASAQEPPPAYACRQDVWQKQEGDAIPGRSHVAGMVEAANGDLLFHADADAKLGPDPYRPEWPTARAVVTRMAPGTSTWGTPSAIPYGQPDSTHNTVLFTGADGTIHNFFTVRRGGSHSESTLEYATSADHGRTWSDPVFVREEHGWMFGNRPFRMSNGEAIVPVYKEAFPWGVGFLVSGDDFATWEVFPSPVEGPWPGIGVGGLQGATEELEDGHLVSFMRTQARLIYRTESFDYGRTWTPAVPTEFPNPWSRVDLIKAPDGSLVLAYNPSASDRTPLVLTLSEDGGLTWPYEVTVEDEPDQRFSYPFLFITSDGMIHLGYSHRENAVNMRHVVFNEGWVRSGVPMPSHVEPQVLELADGELREVEVCAYRLGAGDPSSATADDRSDQAPAPGADDESTLPATGGGAALIALVLLIAARVTTRPRH